ncbi:MAG: hypothetical protein IPI46_06055 [Bacteroidetes bacterium]|nr:hypothetical protein [Bacteroidota bacterium]
MQDSNKAEAIEGFTDISTESAKHNELQSSGAWAKFIGIVYVLSAAMVLILIVLVIANLEMLAQKLIVLNGLSESTLLFLMGAGKWLFTFIMLVSGSVFFLNGFFLLKFGNSTKQYLASLHTEYIAKAFHYLGRYMMLTAVLSVLSTVLSLAALLFYIFS